MNSARSILKAAALLGSILALTALTSCNTVSGLGRDLENSSNAVQNATSR